MHESGSSAKSIEVAGRIADQLAGCGVKLVASLPDNWTSELISTLDRDTRFRQVPVNAGEPPRPAKSAL